MEEVEVSGIRVKFPICYFDSSRISASFPAPIVKVQKALPSKQLKPVQIKPGTTAISFSAYEHRQVEGYERYNEFGISVPVLYKTADREQGLPGIYVFHMPVTTEETRRDGVEWYGFTKFIADIGFEDVGEMRRCRVGAGGKDIITLDVKKMDTEPISLDFHVYTVKDGQLMRTLVQTYGQAGTSSLTGGASYILGDHIIAEELRNLEMGETALEYSFTLQMQMMLHKPGERLPM